MHGLTLQSAIEAGISGIFITGITLTTVTVFKTFHSHFFLQSTLLTTDRVPAVLVVAGIVGNVSLGKTVLVRPVGSRLSLPSPVDPSLTGALERLCLDIVKLAHKLLVFADRQITVDKSTHLEKLSPFPDLSLQLAT